MKTTIIRRQFDSTVKAIFPDYPPLLTKIYKHRGIYDQQLLDKNLTELLPFNLLKGIDEAVDCLVDAIKSNKKILIIGDFDADGATSTTVAMRGLKKLGAKQVSYIVPSRFDFGYGLTPEIVEYGYKEANPDIILTVDNGISSITGVDKANELGIEVVVTDHHLAGDELPKARAIVNPNQPGCQFPSKNLAGVGVMFYVLMALRAKLREVDYFAKNNLKLPFLSNLLDIVALGTVADVVPLDQNNRILVYQGLGRIKQGQAVPGILALLKISKRKLSQLSASDLGFTVAPRLNAAGRLADMSLGIECLLTDDPTMAEELAQQLDSMNQERQLLERQMQAQAVEILDSMNINANDTYGVCLFNPEWHQGIIGILSARVKEKVHRPVICCCQTDKNEIKGSARSIPGVHIRDILAKIDAKNPGLLSKYGGHAMAAGLSLKPENIEKFQKLFNETVKDSVNQDDLLNKILSDGELSETDLNLETANLLKQAGPWGQNFPEPVFDGQFEVVQQKVVGERHLKLTLKTNKQLVEAIAFNFNFDNWSNQVNKIFAAYRLSINDFLGRQSLQLMLDYVEPFS